MCRPLYVPAVARCRAARRGGGGMLPRTRRASERLIRVAGFDPLKAGGLELLAELRRPAATFTSSVSTAKSSISTRGAPLSRAADDGTLRISRCPCSLRQLSTDAGLPPALIITGEGEAYANKLAGFSSGGVGSRQSLIGTSGIVVIHLAAW